MPGRTVTINSNNARNVLLSPGHLWAYRRPWMLLLLANHGQVAVHDQDPQRVKENGMASDTVKPGAPTEKLHFCSEHNIPCEQCPSCKTYSYCPECEKCYEPDCAES